MRHVDKEYIVLAIVISVFFFVFTTIALHRYWQYAAWYYDFGIFYTAIASVAQAKDPVIDHFIFTDKHIFADHFHPIIFLASPFVALFMRGETILVFQTAFVALSGVFLFFLAKHLLKNSFESFLILLIYYSFVGLHNALITEFHEITLLPLPLMMFFYGMVRKHSWWYFVGLVGTLLTKELTFIIPAWFGLLVAWRNKGSWRKIGVSTSVISVVYGLFVFFVLFPLINGVGNYYAVSTKDSFTFTFLNSFKVTTIFKTLLSFGFLPILAPETLPPVLCNWFTRFSAEGSTRHDLGLHYNAEIAPSLILGTIYGWMRLKQAIIERAKNSYFRVHLDKLPFFLCGIALFTFFLSGFIFKSPALLFFHPAFYAHTKNFVFLDTLVEHIPDDGVLMAQTNIAAKLGHRKVYMLRENYKKFNPDYIIVDTRSGQEPNNFLGIQDHEALFQALAADSQYKVYYRNGEQIIYQRVE